LKQEALDRTMSRTRFGSSCGPAVRQTAGWLEYLERRLLEKIYDPIKEKRKLQNKNK